MVRETTNNHRSSSGFIAAGVFYDGKVSRGYAVELHCSFSKHVTLHPTSGDAQSQFPNAHFDELTIASRIGNTPRYIDFPDNSRFETLDNAAIDHWLGEHHDSSWTGLAHRLESQLRYVLLGLCVVALFAWFSVVYGIPATSNLIAQRVPIALTQRLGQDSLALMDERLFSESKLSEQRQLQLQKLFEQYFSDQIEPLSLQLHFRSSDVIGPNAFAMPSGDLVFTDQIVNLAGDDLEILAVMAHEVGHIERRHMLRRVIQSTFMVFVVTMIVGDVSSMVVAAPSLLLDMSFSRDFETEADQVALQFLNDNHIDPVHFSNMMARMQHAAVMKQHNARAGQATSQPSSSGNQQQEEQQGGKQQEVWIEQLGEYLSSHPATDKRIQMFGAPSVSFVEP